MAIPSRRRGEAWIHWMRRRPARAFHDRVEGSEPGVRTLRKRPSDTSPSSSHWLASLGRCRLDRRQQFFAFLRSDSGQARSDTLARHLNGATSCARTSDRGSAKPGDVTGRARTYLIDYERWSSLRRIKDGPLVKLDQPVDDKSLGSPMATIVAGGVKRVLPTLRGAPPGFVVLSGLQARGNVDGSQTWLIGRA